LAKWNELSGDSHRAAKVLLDVACLRSSVSRAYFAAYCAVAARLDPKHLPRDWDNPHHSQLPKLVLRTLKFNPPIRSSIAADLRYLWYARIEADYRPETEVDFVLARSCILRSAQVCQKLGAS
jgi:uncharacterized protein (UPF0332 family)